MILALAALVELAQRCAPEVATEAVIPLVMTESKGDPLRLNINNGPSDVRVRSAAEGAAIVRRYMAAGYTVDVGLAQINSDNFARFGVSPEEVFEPCENLHLASLVLQEDYSRASRVFAGMDAITTTYSLYNSGRMSRGFRNGYVARVLKNSVVSNATALSGAMARVHSANSPTSAPTPEGGGEISPVSPPPLHQKSQWVVGQTDGAGVVVF